MRRAATLVLAALLVTLLGACGGNYTGTQSIDSLSTATPGRVPTSQSGNPSLSEGGGFSETQTAAGAGAAVTTTVITAPTAGASASAEPSAAATSAAGNETATGVAMTAAPADTTATGAASGSGTLPNLNGRRILIGTDSAFPPFESIEQGTNSIVGFDPDLMAEIAKLINIQPEFQSAVFDTIFVALAGGQFDAVMSAVTITDERRQQVDFSEPYVGVGQQVVTLGTNTTITSYTDLKNNNLKVGVQRGTTGEQAALTTAGIADENVRRYDDIPAAFADLRNNAIDAIVVDGPTVANYLGQPEYRDVLKLVGDPFTTEDYGIAIKKGDTELLNAINAALVELRANGKIEELKQKYNLK